jgi:Nitrate and nitrite sensing
MNEPTVVSSRGAGLRLRTRLILPLVLPILGALILSGWLMSERLRTTTEMRQVVTSDSLVSRITALVYEPQRERGLSNVVLATEGGAVHDALIVQRAQTDRAAGVLVDRLRDFDASGFLPALAGRIAQAHIAPKALGSTRQGIDRLDVPMNKSSLKSFCPNDPVLPRPVERPKEWYPGPVEYISIGSATFAGAAESAAKLLRHGACRALTKGVHLQGTTGWGASNGAGRVEDGNTEHGPGPGAAEDTEKELHKLQIVPRVVEHGSGGLSADLRTFKPVDQDREAHMSSVAYAQMLVLTARAFIEKRRREAEAFAARDGEGRATCKPACRPERPDWRAAVM